MLSFSTEYPVVCAEPSRFSDCVGRWLLNSPHSTFTSDELSRLNEGTRSSIEKGAERIEALRFVNSDSAQCAYRYSIRSDGLQWVTNVVFSADTDSAWVGIRTSREADGPTLKLKPAKKPQIVKAILADLDGGLDGELFVKDAPHYVRDNDIGMVARLLNGDSTNYLPIVYVSKGFNGEYALKADVLARSLGGLAHVIVEPTRGFSVSLQDLTDSRNAYGGAIGFYTPNGTNHRYLGLSVGDFELRSHIVEEMRVALTNRRPLPRCTWASVEAFAARQTLEGLKAGSSEDLNAYVEAFDAETAALRSQLEDANEEVDRLQRTAQGQKKRDSTGSGLEFNKVIQEFFEGEADEIVFNAFESALGGVSADSRRSHILSELMNKLSPAGELQRRKEEIKAILRGVRGLEGDTERRLSALGFQISSDGKHHKLVYNDDQRYVFAIPKSASDHRSGLNLASDISRKIF